MAIELHFGDIERNAQVKRQEAKDKASENPIQVFMGIKLRSVKEKIFCQHLVSYLIT